MLEFNKVKLNSADKVNIDIEEISLKDIAIIGMSAEFPMAEDVNKFWENLKYGIDCITEFPKSREKDANYYLELDKKHNVDIKYFRGAYLKEIDKFDYKFFRLSPKEASLMSPNQRMFLETAWKAIEDAGYGGNKLVGSRTGVYIGFEADAPYDYKRFIAEIDSSSISYAVPGNLTSIIASRISYLLDFRGPSMSIDTACSSALVAIHSACRAIRYGECEMALAGSIKINLLPIEGQLSLGIISSDGRARSFDDSSDGTGSGEGVAAILLKPFNKAIADGDNIYAVIKGTSINQDGSSIGITAPNVLAQEDVIVNAWKDSGIEPETVTYIEAHGTGTKLGDPIEIDGIQRAFRRYTNNKQFCAIGSVKTNLGHLDNAAGIAGLIKAVLALKHRQIPPSLHFNKPNSKIPFEQSPVYICDRLMQWETDGFPRRCDISSFGFSGTNCHVVLEEYQRKDIKSQEIKDKTDVFILSAKSVLAMRILLQKYNEYVSDEKLFSISDLCYTANCGRGHYNYRLALIVKSLEDFKKKIKMLSNIDLDIVHEKGIYYSQYKIVPNNKEAREINEFTENEIKELGDKARHCIKQLKGATYDKTVILEELCDLYVKGADVDWEEFYNGVKRHKISLPVYPFERNRCWVENTITSDLTFRINKTETPLLDRCIAKTMNIEIYSTIFSAHRHWVLDEHRIMGNCVLVGTAYLEMVVEACKKHFGNDIVTLKDILFISPLILNEDETREVHLVITNDSDFRKFSVASKAGNSNIEDDNDWVKHVEGKILKGSEKVHTHYNIDQIKEKLAGGYIVPDIDGYNDSTVFQLGKRWKNIKEMYVGDAELLSAVEMPANLVAEVGDYIIHPALLDNALTTVPILQKIFGKDTIGGEGGVFLPFSYGSFHMCSAIPSTFYSYVKLKGAVSEKSEIITYDISLINVDGNVFAEIFDYSLKKVRSMSHESGTASSETSIYHNVLWVEQEIKNYDPTLDTGAILILTSGGVAEKQLINSLRSKGRVVIEAYPGEVFYKLDDDRYALTNTIQDYVRLLLEVQDRNIVQILHTVTWALENGLDSMQALELSQQAGVKSLWYLVKTIYESNIKKHPEIVLLSRYVEKVTGEEEIRPGNATLFGLGSVIPQEYPGWKCRCIDIDIHTPYDKLVRELGVKAETYKTAYRNGIRYVPEFHAIDLSSIPSDKTVLKDNGLYIITGGTGGIGLEIARYISSKAKVKLALISRSHMPERDEWDSILSKGTDTRLCNVIRAIRKIETTSSKVICCKADVSDMECMEQMLDELRLVYGPICGIVHSAGIAGDGFVINRDTPDFEMVLAPKVQGTYVLDHLTRQDNPDFFVLFSSVTTLTGAPGEGDYTAANCFVDSYGDYMIKHGRKALVVNWAGWKETGMAFNYGISSDGLFKMMMTKEAIEALDEVLGRNITRIHIGQLNYNNEALANGLSLPILLSTEIGKALKKSINQRERVVTGRNASLPDIKLTGRPDGNYNDIEVQVAQVWGEVLGYREINIYDNFYELGGDSISMMTILSKMEDRIKIQISFKDFIEKSTIAGIAALISVNGREIGETIRKTVYPVVTPDLGSIHIPFPLTDVQSAYLLGRDPRFEMGGVSTHAYLEIETKLDLERFNISLNKVIARHPMMHAVVYMNGTQQILENVQDYEMVICDLRNLEKEQQEECILRERKRMSHHVFKSDQWPLYEFKAFKLTDYINYLFIGFDVMIADAFSLQIIFKELLKFYDNPNLVLPPLDFSFRDYMLAYKEFKNSEMYNNSKQYWLSKLDDFPAAPVLPLKKHPAGVTNPYFKRSKRVFEKLQWEKLKKTAQKNSITPSALLCTAYADVLSFWSNQQQLAINLTVFNRYPFHQDINSIVGDFTSVILLGLDLQAGMSFWDKARHVQATLMEALEHRHYDGIEFIRDISRYNNMGTRAVMPVVFTSMFFEMDESSEEPGEIKVGLTQTPQVYIDHQVTEKNGDLVVQWDFVEDIFEKQVIDTMFEQYTSIIEKLIQGETQYRLEPHTDDLSLIKSYNQTQEAVPYNTLHRLFVEQAERTPDLVAIKFDSYSMTYRELHLKSNQTAHFLKQHGICRGDMVGVIAQRCIATIVNVIGVLKAGGAYVPIEPEYPEERKRYIIENSGCRMILEPEFYKERNISIYSEDEIDGGSTLEDIAYIIYTSGSTGRPKGVVITHRAVSNTILDINRKFNVSEKDRVIGVSSMCFDLSVYDIFGSLAAGAQLVLVRDQRDIANLAETVEKQGITIWNSVPAIINMIMDNIGTHIKNTCLRLVMLSGDWVPLSLIPKIMEYCVNTKVISLGGATEASIWSIYYPINEIRETWKSIPYGMPLANQEFYILDYKTRLCPVGVQGELYIGGIGLAKGYRNDMEKTKGAFIQHPELGNLYRTGDYGILHNEGYIEFLGRKDHQVKIRGFRIELGEIESCLMKHKLIKNAVVIDRSNVNGRTYLCAYVVADGMPSVHELREYLSAVLPDYMLPSYFVQMDKIPLTSNGKVDRKALPEPEGKTAASTEYVAPENTIEQELVDIWRDVLRMERVGVTDNFFEVGGSSIQLIDMHTKIDHMYPGKVKITDIFGFVTVARLAELINGDKTKKSISFKPLKLQYGIYHEEYTGAEYLDYQFHIDGELLEKIGKIAAKENAQTYDFLLMVLMYLFAQITGQNEVAIETMLEVDNESRHICVDLSDIEEFSQFVYRLNEQRIGIQENTYSIMHLARNTTNKDKFSIIPFFFRKNLMTSNISILNTFDIAFEIDEDANKISFLCEYDAGKLNKDFVKELIMKYMKLITIAVG